MYKAFLIACIVITALFILSLERKPTQVEILIKKYEQSYNRLEQGNQYIREQVDFITKTHDKAVCEISVEEIACLLKAIRRADQLLDMSLLASATLLDAREHMVAEPIRIAEAQQALRRTEDNLDEIFRLINQPTP